MALNGICTAYGTATKGSLFSVSTTIGNTFRNKNHTASVMYQKVLNIINFLTLVQLGNVLHWWM